METLKQLFVSSMTIRLIVRNADEVCGAHRCGGAMRSQHLRLLCGMSMTAWMVVQETPLHVAGVDAVSVLLSEGRRRCTVHEMLTAVDCRGQTALDQAVLRQDWKAANAVSRTDQPASQPVMPPCLAAQEAAFLSEALTAKSSAAGDDVACVSCGRWVASAAWPWTLPHRC